MTDIKICISKTVAKKQLAAYIFSIQQFAHEICSTYMEKFSSLDSMWQERAHAQAPTTSHGEFASNSLL